MEPFQDILGGQFREKIKHVWHGLTDEEIAYHDTMRDMFFMAIRKKHGISRAEAEEILRTLAHNIHYDDAA